MRAISTTSFRLAARRPLPARRERQWWPSIDNCQKNYKHKFEDGVNIEVLYMKPKVNERSNPVKPPLIFLHGSYHAAWAFDENFLPYFSELGYPSFALSFRGQGESDAVLGNVAGTVEAHADDVAHFVEKLKAEFGLETPPVILGHSFGGYIVLQYVSEMKEKRYPQVSGIGCLCAVPPSGNKEMIQRFLKRDLWLSLKITWAFITKSFTRSLDECRYCFFSDDMDINDLQRYYAKFQSYKDSIRLIDLRAFANKPTLPKPSIVPPALVLGAANDKVVDKEGVEETAEWFDVQPIFIDQMNHDCMLDTRWKLAAQGIYKYLQSLQ